MSLPILRTNRLLLRPWTREDVDALHALWTTFDVRRYLWDDIVITREVAQAIVESHLESAAQHRIGYWAILAPNEPQLAGFCGFRFIDDGSEIELQYGLKREHWAPNEASVRVMVRLGMTHVSTTPSMITYVLRR